MSVISGVGGSKQSIGIYVCSINRCEVVCQEDQFLAAPLGNRDGQWLQTFLADQGRDRIRFKRERQSLGPKLAGDFLLFAAIGRDQNTRAIWIFQRNVMHVRQITLRADHMRTSLDRFGEVREGPIPPAA